MKTSKITYPFHGSVSDLRPGHRFMMDTKFWIVGAIMKPFDRFTVRISATPESDQVIGSKNGSETIKSGEYMQISFGKEVVL